ncbi:HEAT repeat domain-containing protein [Streptomyces sp. ISL-11]|uniref:HEAT repeat domain-containing protein n=1 Tax=Streptomyces sp. ISL-11 TaxID=2819174 RepID=UPI001BE5E4D9|nr:HEAT repeat domain-containing protein [Streptomyces sp. ISL-11]MBT2387659.1 HEAT repeat domain-containing protein [Streptomyces sp. ISL-11]
MEQPPEYDVDELVRMLDGSPGDSMDARAALIHLGPGVLPAIVRGLPRLGRFGQLTAIEVFEELDDERCVPALVELLGSEHDTVREWSAIALGDLGAVEAVEPLWRAYRACQERRTPPDTTEPDGIRGALTQLGARTPVMPSLTASLRVGAPGLGDVWPPDRLAAVVDDLAGHGQAVLSVQFWRTGSGGASWLRGPAPDRELDWEAPWPELVGTARARAARVAGGAPGGVVASLSWIDRADRDGTPSPAAPVS